MRRMRIVIWGLIAAAIVAIGLYFLLQPSVHSAAEQTTVNSDNFGGPFTLVGSDGKPFASSQLNGKPYALFFGFTHCPDTCPTTLARLVRLRREAGGDGAFNIVFVTVDPARDGPREMGAYGKAFGAPIIGLTGTRAQIDKVKKQFGIYSLKVPDGNGDYTIDHTAVVLLFDRNGKFVATLAPDEQDPAALDKFKRMKA